MEAVKRSIDLTGEVFGKWTVLYRTKNRKGGQTMWFCKCQCGEQKNVISQSLREGKSMSCGCTRPEQTRKQFRRHGQHGTRSYVAWQGMLRRCYETQNKSYLNYGGRGITVCARWFKFENFFADMGQPIAGMSLERVKNKLGYSKSNCKWATTTEQNNNRRYCVVIRHRGLSLNVTQWAHRLNQRPGKIFLRLRRGWSHRRALDTP